MVNSHIDVHLVDVYSLTTKSTARELWHATLGEGEKKIVVLYTFMSSEVDKQQLLGLSFGCFLLCTSRQISREH